jgi:glycosyltransferase involved in cell wall biosynthesis
VKVGLIVPCYNESDVLRETAKRLLSVLADLTDAGKIDATSRIWFVDDGSRDRTWEIIEELHQRDERCAGIKLSRNRGHQNALLAGLFTAEGDALISLDADLQDDVTVVETMVDACAQGYEIVFGVRKRRPTDTAFKRLTAEAYYRILRAAGVDSISNHADFRLMSRRAIDCLKEFREVNLFLRGIVPMIGLRSTIVYYDRGERYAGKSKYPLGKMLRFALEGITSFSAAPLRLIAILGLVFSVSSILAALWALSVRLIDERAVPGWASTVLPVYFLGGVQLFSIGVIGEYLMKIYIEVKDRPRYFIEKIL